MNRGVAFVLSIVLSLTAVSQGRSWKEIKERGAGEVIFYWYPNNIEISESKDVIDGVERELSEVFIKFINDYYQIEVAVIWEETRSFSEVLTKIEKAESMGVFGASSISITESRSHRFNFAPAYLSDIAVLISHPEVPVSLTEDQFLNDLKGATAITIPETTISQAILEINTTEQLGLNIAYVSNSGQIIEQVEKTPNSYAYIDLPNFLVAFDNTNVKRQYFHPIKGEGLAFIYPIGSDWSEPVDLYFHSDQFVVDRDRILNKYFGNEIGQIIRRISRSAEFGPFEEIIVSQQEKELQNEELLKAAIQEKNRTRQLALLWGVIVTFTMAVILLVVRYLLKSKANDQLVLKQNEIENQNVVLQKLNQDKNELIKIIAHDLRSPLTTVQGASQFISSNPNLTEQEKKLNGLSQQAVERMKQMISKVLDTNAIEQGSNELKLQPTDLSPLVGQLLDQHRGWAEEKQIELRLIKESEPRSIMTDPFYLMQVLDNLISNAIKFSEKGSRVLVLMSTIQDHVKLAISDEGPGIATEELPRLFEKYSKLSAVPTAGEPSIGLGLAIVKSYVDFLGAKIEVHSKLGEGTTFSVLIPFA